jgi:transposase
MKNQRKTRKRYDTEFKKEVVRLIDQGRSVKSLSESFELTPAQIYNWRSKYGSTSTEQQERETIRELEAELRKIKEERDILKKAMAYLSRESHS